MKQFRKQEALHFDAVSKIAQGDGNELFAVIDLFSGAGGVTTGIEMAEIAGKKVAEVICAINHDRKAIECHWQNHPHVKHFVEDIRKFNVKNLPKVSAAGKYKLLWASLECTNHSNAKGGLSRDADSRTLAEHLPPYITEFQPDYIGIENVREFREWGPLVQKRDPKGRLIWQKRKTRSHREKRKPVMLPDKAKKGIDYRRWVESICALGYTYEEKILNATDFGVNTSRKRLFIIFAKAGMPIVWPEPTHSRTGDDGKLKYRPVKECLDFSKKGQSIFNRKKNLSENTYKRIYAGLVKFIAKGDESFLSQYNGWGFDDRAQSENEPSRTVTVENRFALVQPEFITKYYGTGKNICSIDDPAATLTSKDRLAVINAEHLLMKYNSVNGKTGRHVPPSIDDPAPVVSTQVRMGVVTAEHFVAKHYSSHNNTQQNAGSSIENPSPTTTVRPNLGMVTVEHFMDHQFSSGQKNKSIEEPAGSLTVVPKQNLVSVYVMNTNYGNIGVDLNDPMFALVSSRRHPYLVQLETGQIAIAIEKDDTEIMKKIKMFMAAYGIIGIYMRMLMISELLKITGLPENYFEGCKVTQGDMKKYIGNAVPPRLPKVMIEALGKQLTKQSIKAA